MGYHSKISYALVTLSACASGFSQVTVRVEIDPVFARHGIEAIGFTSPEFQSALSRLAGVQAANSIAELQPYTLLVRNTNPAPLYKVVIRYPRINETGKPVEGSIPHRIGDSPQTVASGAVIILTPNDIANQALNSRTNVSLDVQSAVNQGRTNFQERFSTARFSRPSIILDLVIFSDGGFVGPDIANTISQEQDQLAVESEVLAMLNDASVSDAALAQALSAFYDARWAPSANIKSAVRLHRGGLAHAVGDALQAQGRASAVKWLEMVQSRRPSASALHRLE